MKTTCSNNWKNKFGKNMNYTDLYDSIKEEIKKESTTGLPIYNIPPQGLVVYRFKNKNCRATIESLKLTSDHKARSPTAHVFGSDILISRGFKAEVYSSSTFYCAWIESNPHILIVWERDTTNGITSVIKNDRFILESSLSVFKYLPICTDEYVEGLSKRDLCQQETSLNGLLINTAVENEIAKSLNSVDEVIARAPCIDYIEIDEEKLQRKLECFQKVLVKSSNYCINPPLADDNDEGDPNWSISALREVFVHVCCLGDAVMNLRQYPWQNMQKTALNELKSEWESAIRTVREKKLDGLIPESLWLQSMWLHVLGFPSCVRTKEDVLPMIYSSFSKLRDFDKDSVLCHLENDGFRLTLAFWIHNRFYLDSFEEDVLKLSSPLPWNSFLCSVNGFVHFTRLQGDGNGDNTQYSRVEPTNPLYLHIDGEGNYRRGDILPIELRMEQENWFPKDFAKKAFEELKTVRRSNHYILGHCTAEQCIVGMCKTGISLLATYNNVNSCGRGMYFFRLDFDVLECSFEELNSMSVVDDTNPLGIQFRAFVYALFTVFQKADCDATSPSILVFLVPLDEHLLDPYDAISLQLPTCNDDASPAGWKCSQCPRLTKEFSTNGVSVTKISNSTRSAANVKDAISMVSDDVEKYNAMAILGGVVDFQRIPNGVYSAIIADNNSNKVAVLLRDMENWSSLRNFEKWNFFVTSENISVYRRPVTFFNVSGRFSDVRQLLLPKGNGRKTDWSTSGANDPIRETVFVSKAALNTLLQRATSIFCVFVSPDDALTERKVYEQMQKQPPTDDTIGTVFSDDIRSLISGRHLYWENRHSCMLKGCLPLDTKAVES